MVGTGLLGVTATGDPFVDLAVAALRLQEEGLRAAAHRLAHCRAAVPASADDTWQGPAGSAYETGLDQLRRVLVAAVTALDDALTETRRAVATLEQEFG